MKVCAYCGKENEEMSAFCADCGTALAAGPQGQSKQPKPIWSRIRLGPDLNAASATAILLAYLATEFLCVGVAMAYAIIRSHGTHNPDLIFRTLDKLMPAVRLAIPVLGCAAILLTSSALVPSHLKNTSANGAAWVRGSWTAIAQGFVIGLFIEVCTYVLSGMLRTHAQGREISSLLRMAMTPGVPRLFSALTSLLAAPLTEELLFRGALYGGYRKSFGPIWAAVLTTSLFLLLHLPIHRVPILLGITALAAAALWCRLRTAAIGPAIALHAGFNSWGMFVIIFQ